MSFKELNFSAAETAVHNLIQIKKIFQNFTVHIKSTKKSFIFSRETEIGKSINLDLAYSF